ncbi:PAS domain S-box protein [Haloarcula sp. CBA1122]|uniref:PAS domain S-box protein n=1 Tax=Haloarcula sp. CBA1122 TaxID=2668069 RepID=UPI001307B551|nr:PAS domain S-box protein [Haloarcula sp. CBA1122]MUV49818.1 PAS domain S-box protein [Haloarcula sp. CBA1122]
MYGRFVTALWVLTGLSAVFSLLAWRKREDPGGTPMVVFHLALSVGAASYAVDITATTLSTQLLARQVATIAQGAVAISWLHAALQYADFDRAVTRRAVGLLSLDLLMLMAVFVFPGVSLFDLPPSGSVGSLVVTPGTGLTAVFVAHMATILIAALAGTIVLVQLFVRSRHLYRTQAAAVLVAALAPWTIALTQQYFLQIPEDATIFAWGVSGIAMTTGLYTFKTLDPVPAAQETIVEQMGDGTLVLDVDGCISHANPAAETLLAGPEETLVGQQVDAVIPTWDKVTVDDDGQSDWSELALSVDGQQRFVELEVSPFTDRFDGLVGRLVVLRDVTERKQREQQLAQYKTIFEGVSEPVYVLDEHDRFVTYNDPFAELVGTVEDSLVGERFETVLGQMETEPMDDEPGEFLIRTASGEQVPCEVDAADIELASGESGRVGIVRDISQRKEIESELAVTTERLETLVEAAPLAIIATDTDGVVEVWNPAATELFGWSADEVLGETVPVIPAENRRQTAELHAQVLEGERLAGHETELQRKDGSRVDVSLAAAPIRGLSGSVVGSVSVITDITDQKRRERQLQLQNERLDEFASLVSHDLRNPLQVASGHLELASQDASADVRESITAATDALNRMETLIDHTLTLAREGRDIGDPEPVSLRDTFARAWDAAPTSAAERRIRDPPERVLADLDRLAELFQNLVQNAVEHGSDGATPGAGPAADGGGVVTITLGATPDGFYVADDGPGIPPDQRDAVLESGYSTDDDGTGFGLAIVETIAEAHGWELTVTDSEAGGARFEFSGVETGSQGEEPTAGSL